MSAAHWINGATGVADIHDSICELQQASERTMDRIERRYSGRVRIEVELQRRREIERETQKASGGDQHEG